MPTKSSALPVAIGITTDIGQGARNDASDRERTLRDRFRRYALSAKHNSGDFASPGLRLLAKVSIMAKRIHGDDRMSLSLAAQFEANLHGLNKPIRIKTRHDAEVFICRWTIRDKDPTLKALLRDMQRANSSATVSSAILGLKHALAFRGLLVRVDGFA